MFKKFIIDYETNLFEELSNSTQFEDVTKGRQGTVLVDCKGELVPIVRTTSCYDKPAQKFLPIHYDIVNNIKKITNNPKLKLNNALIEIYNSDYRTMGYHSDQALDLLRRKSDLPASQERECDLERDLADHSYIAIFSCYSDGCGKYPRTLKVKKKGSTECFDITMEHNSVVLFSLEINRQYLHKIILEGNSKSSRWLGITFRLSKTFVQFKDEIPYLHFSDSVLRLASNEDKQNFYKLRGQENRSIEYTYPEIDYTISKSDLMYPVG
jgi:hypothetical protein